MKIKVFVDTNILIYLQEGLDKSKHEIAVSLFEKLADENVIALSTQVLQEFYVAMTKKLGHDPVAIKRILQLFEKFEINTIQVDTIQEAIDISILNKLSYWESLIIASAIESKCKFIYTEDLNHGQVIKGVKIVNPFM